MPFLKSVEVRDTLALRSLNYISGKDANDFRELMSHPRIKDGITDEETKIVAVLGGHTYSRAPGSTQVLLSETGVYIEERLIELPHTGETLLAVIRVEDKDTPSMDNFEHAVRVIEEFMGVPYPIDYLALLYYDREDQNANNNFTHLHMLPRADEAGPQRYAGVIAHEAAHWYWSGDSEGYQYRKWITEGSADFLRVISEHERIGRPLDPIKPPCHFFDNISELEKANPDRTFIPGQSTPRECYYSLGNRFFLDLYLALGDETFRTAYRALYLRYQQDDRTDGCGGPALNICRVEAAFKDGASDEVIAKVDRVIDRWYYGNQTPTPTRPPKPTPAPRPATPFEDTPAARLLKTTYSRVYQGITELPWAQDQITGPEHDAIEWLYWLADRNWRATVALLDLPWLQDSITETESDAIEWLYWLAEEDWRAVAEVVAKPFLKTLEAEDVQTIREMSGRDSESYLGRLSASYPSVDEPLQGLSWPQPPYTETELDAIEWLYRLAREDRRAAAIVAAMPWVQDGMNHTERGAVKWLYYLTRESEDIAAKVIAMPWVQDDITETERNAIKRLYYLTRESEDIAAKVIAMPWVQDDITETERNAIEQISWLNDDDDENVIAIMEAVLALPWIRDGITEVEGDAIDQIESLDDRSERTAAAVIAMPWFQDGITDTESDAVNYLRSISYRNADAAAELIAMPFLKSVEVRDTLALRSLNYISGKDANDFRELMSHPRIKDGITDEETKIVAVLGGRTYSYAPGSTQVLLAETGVYIEERVIGLPHTGETLLAVIRTQDRVTPRMDHFEHTVRSIERFMGEPFPIDYLALLYYDHPDVNNANNNFTHLLIPAESDSVDGPDWHASVIAHEAAHWYWRGSSEGYQYQNWISEGSAEFLRIISEHERIERPLEPIKPPCPFFDNISELEKANPDRTFIPGQTTPRICYYSLGQRFFLDLYLALGDETFRTAYRALYLRYQQDDRTDGCGGPALNICRVEAAFKDGASAEVVRKVDEVIARWYGPRP